MSLTSIIITIAVIGALIVFGVPLYVVIKRNRIALESKDEAVQEPTVTAEVTPVNDGPQLAEQPVLTSGPISVGLPVPEVKPAGKRRAPGGRIEPKKETKRTAKKPAEKKAPAKSRKKKDEVEPVLSKEFASKHGLRISDTETKATKKTTKKTTKATKKTTKTK